MSAARTSPFTALSRLPSYAAAYREKKGPVSRADLADVEQYAVGDYLRDWLRGPRDAAAVARIDAARRGADRHGPGDRAAARRRDRQGRFPARVRARAGQGGRLLRRLRRRLRSRSQPKTWSRSLDPVAAGFDRPFHQRDRRPLRAQAGLEDRGSLRAAERGGRQGLELGRQARTRPKPSPHCGRCWRSTRISAS